MTRLSLAVTAVFIVSWIVWPEGWSLVFVICLAAAFVGGGIIRAQHPQPVVVRQAQPKRRRGRTRFVFGLGIGLHGVWPFVVLYRRPR